MNVSIEKFQVVLIIFASSLYSILTQHICIILYSGYKSIHDSVSSYISVLDQVVNDFKLEVVLELLLLSSPELL